MASGASPNYVAPVTYSNGRLLEYVNNLPPPAPYQNALDKLCVTYCTNSSGSNRCIYYSTPSWACYGYKRDWSPDDSQQNLTCCNTALCNKPDPAKDTMARVVGRPWGSPASLACYVHVEDPPTLPTGTAAPAAAFLMKFTAYESLEVNRYGDMRSTWSTVFEHKKSEPAMCARFRYTNCYGTGGRIESCVRWAYRLLPVSQCLELQQHAGSIETNVTCCSTDGCNAPDPQQDPITQRLLLAEPVPQAVNITCYKSMYVGESITADVPPAVYPVTFDAKTTHFEVQYPAAASYWRSVAVDPVVCYSARVDVCAAGTKACSAEEEAAGNWVWQYDAMPLSQCYQQQWAASRGSLAHLQGVNCCVSDLCNRPNPADDNSTQVSVVNVQQQK